MKFTKSDRNASSVGPKCPVCKESFGLRNRITECPRCHAPHHEDCLTFIGADCSVFGCGPSAPMTDRALITKYKQGGAESPLDGAWRIVSDARRGGVALLVIGMFLGGMATKLLTPARMPPPPPPRVESPTRQEFPIPAAVWGLVGTYEGHYVMDSKPYPFTLIVQQQEGGHFSGTIVEPVVTWGPARWTHMTAIFSGTYNEAEQKVAWTKVYTSGRIRHSVMYHGDVRGEDIQGRWGVGGSSGGFSMTRMPNDAEHMHDR